MTDVGVPGSGFPAEMPPLSQAEIREGVERLSPWFHNLDLGGIATAPAHFLGDHPRGKWERFRHLVPGDLTGKSVLDIGCNAGFFSMEMKRRGAARVLGVDSDPRYLEQARFASRVLGLEVEYRQVDVHDLDRLGERFDLVLFMGVLYHLRHPLLALDLIHDHVVGDLLLYQSLQRGSRELALFAPDYPFGETDVFDDERWPTLHFVERRYAGDPSNWWIPNRACSQAMLRAAGFEILDSADDDVCLCRRVERPSLEDL